MTTHWRTRQEKTDAHKNSSSTVLYIDKDHISVLFKTGWVHLLKLPRNLVIQSRVFLQYRYSLFSDETTIYIFSQNCSQSIRIQKSTTMSSYQWLCFRNKARWRLQPIQASGPCYFLSFSLICAWEIEFCLYWHSTDDSCAIVQEESKEWVFSERESYIVSLIWEICNRPYFVIKETLQHQDSPLFSWTSIWKKTKKNQ